MNNAGAGKRFLIYIEIARHPEGLTVSELTEKFKGKKPGNTKFSSDKISIWRYVSDIRNRGLITTDYEPRNGKVSLVCRATKDGVFALQDEMCRLCHLLHKVQKEQSKCDQTE